MKNSKKWLKIFCAAMVCMLFPLKALAADIYSSWGTIPASTLNDPANVTYNYRAALRHELGSATGTAQIYGDKDIPQSYAGAMAELYSTTGTLLAASRWNYNNSGPTRNIAANITYYGSRSLYCKATFGVMSSVGEKIFTAQTSSAITRSVRNAVAINENGLRYGSGLANEKVDLILVEGDSGKEGYVYYQDLYGVPAETWDEYLEKIETCEKSRTLSVYDESGMNMIDSFTID
ncbi:hypothetical protein [Acetatifactor muris]|uniref:hypothetical protein n=1 Tax=Acetatifactor muris TaxID=879566 RepID=UPI0023F4E24F|nr:hypothetical protein [Acetatifactor muris]